MSLCEVDKPVTIQYWKPNITSVTMQGSVMENWTFRMDSLKRKHDQNFNEIIICGA